MSSYSSAGHHEFHEYDVDRPVYWFCDVCGGEVTRAHPGKFGVDNKPTQAVFDEVRRLHAEGKHKEATAYKEQADKPEWGVYHLSCSRPSDYDVEYECEIFDVAWRLIKLGYEIGRLGLVESYTDWHRFRANVLKRSGASAALGDPEIDNRPLDYRAQIW